MNRNKPSDPVLVVGLGRFGGAAAETLVDMGHEVLGVDADGARVQALSARVTSVVEVASTSAEAMRQIGAADFPRAVVAIGSHIEASLLTVGVLVDLGVEHIWAKALTRAHGKLLARIGATQVIYPEHDMGERVAHMVTGRMLEYVELDESFAVVSTLAPRTLVGRTLFEAHVRSRYGVTIVCHKPPGASFTYATADTFVPEGTVLVVAAPRERAEAFTKMA